MPCFCGAHNAGVICNRVPSARRPTRRYVPVTPDEVAQRQAGIDYPEVEIREIWQRTLSRFVTNDTNSLDYSQFALEYELRVNPTWPMPGANLTLSGLHETGMVMGTLPFLAPERWRELVLQVAGLDDRSLRRMGLVSMGLGLLLLLWLR